MYKCMKIRHDIRIQCHGYCMEIEKINYMLEIDIFKKILSNDFGCPEGCILGVWVSKRHPDALLALPIFEI